MSASWLVSPLASFTPAMIFWYHACVLFACTCRPPDTRGSRKHSSSLQLPETALLTQAGKWQPQIPRWLPVPHGAFTSRGLAGARPGQIPAGNWIWARLSLDPKNWLAFFWLRKPLQNGYLMPHGNHTRPMPCNISRHPPDHIEAGKGDAKEGLRQARPTLASS